MIPLLALLAAAPAVEWDQWRGPNRDAIAAHVSAPAAWPARLTKKWAIPAGDGYSSPVTGAGRVYLHWRQGTREIVTAHEVATGREVWRQSYEAPFQKSSYATRMGSGPWATPLYREGRLYTAGVTAIVSCFDAATGRLLWRQDNSKSVSTAGLFTGSSASPAMAGGHLIVVIGDDRKGMVKAFDPATGKERWSWNEDGAGYSSPIVTGGKVILLTLARAVALSLETGKLVWAADFRDQWNENIVTPVRAANAVLFSAVRRGTVALDLAGKPLWENKDLPMYMSSPVADGTHIYGFSSRNKGQYFCLDVKSGKVLWTSPGRGGETAGLLAAGGALLALNTDGELLVLERKPAAFRQIASYKVADSAVWSQPVPFGNGVLIKSVTDLSYWTW